MAQTYQDVMDFHIKYQVPLKSTPQLLSGDEKVFRINFLKEELKEFEKAHEEGNLEDAIDALIDLAYVTFGAAQFMGISTDQWLEHWNEVQRANMEKVMVESADDSKRGYKFDIKKPASWVGPNHTPIIEKYKAE
jgi:predicted HAD superfamily Cof-like phosphohydrolase